MKKFTFRLEAVFKVRKLKEENCRMELGQLLIELQRIEDQIKHEHSEIEQYYKIQEKALLNGMSGGQIQAFPMLITGKTKNIELLERDKIKQDHAILQKKQELALLKGELKVIQNLREKEFENYRKMLNKEIDQKVEEQTQNWMLAKDRKASI